MSDYSHLPDLRSDETKELDSLHAQIARLRADNDAMVELAKHRMAKNATLRAELAGWKGEFETFMASSGVRHSELMNSVRAAASRDAEEIERLREALETSPCPSPARDDVYTVKQCILLNDCLCDNRGALAPRPQENKT